MCVSFGGVDTTPIQRLALEDPPSVLRLLRTAHTYRRTATGANVRPGRVLPRIRFAMIRAL